MSKVPSLRFDSENLPLGETLLGLEPRIAAL
jgi:hypothetical protein